MATQPPGSRSTGPTSLSTGNSLDGGAAAGTIMLTPVITANSSTTQSLASTSSIVVSETTAVVTPPKSIFIRTFDWFKDPESDAQALGLMISTVAGIVGLFLNLTGITVTSIQGEESLNLNDKANTQAHLSNDYVRLGWCLSISEEERRAIEWCKLHPTPDTFDDEMGRRSLSNPWEYNKLLPVQDQRDFEAHLKNNGFLVGSIPTSELVNLAAKYLTLVNTKTPRIGLLPGRQNDQDNGQCSHKLLNLLLTPLLWVLYRPAQFKEPDESIFFVFCFENLFTQTLYQLSIHLITSILRMTEWREFGQLWLCRERDQYFWLPLFADLGRLTGISMFYWLLRYRSSRYQYYAFAFCAWFFICPDLWKPYYFMSAYAATFPLAVPDWDEASVGASIYAIIAPLVRLASLGIDWRAWRKPSVLSVTIRLALLAQAVIVFESALSNLGLSRLLSPIIWRTRARVDFILVELLRRCKKYATRQA